MVLDQRLFRIEVQPVVTAGELPVEGENNALGQKHGETCLCYRQLTPRDLSLPHGQLLQTCDPADICDPVLFGGLSAAGRGLIRSLRGGLIAVSAISGVCDEPRDEVRHPVPHGNAV